MFPAQTVGFSGGFCWAVFRRTVAALFVVVLLVMSRVPCRADAGPTLTLKRQLVVDEQGDAQVTVRIKMPAALYTRLKQQTPNTAVLLRQLGNGQNWAVLENVRGQFLDMQSTIRIDYLHRGLARSLGKGRWALEIAADAEVDLLGVFDNVAIFTTAANTPLGLATITERVQVPAGSTGLELQSSARRLVYRLPATAESQGPVTVDFRFEVRPQLMSCLGKAYANRRFANLWAARAVLHHTGGQTLEQYRVRFRIPHYTDWSRWMVARQVVAGQTVVDAFFPVFDLDKLARTSGTRPVSIVVEYEYRTAGGQTVRETDRRSAELLGRNEVFFTPLPRGEAVGFHEQFEYGPLVLASLVTGDDPVIQQLAGHISALAGGAAAAVTDKEAVKYLGTLYEFLHANRVSYQTPPTNVSRGQMRQHVKFGRDVLRNRAGTCIDLAILFGSAAQAVGLEPVLFLVPGHCFPAVRLPSGQLLPIEATLLGSAGFEKAVQTGMKNMEKAIRSGEFYAVEVQQLQAQGIRPLELPPVEPDFLDRLGYRFQRPSSHLSQPAPAGRRTSRSPAPEPTQWLQGDWVGVGHLDDVRIRLGFSFRGNSYVMVLYLDRGRRTQKLEDAGTFHIQGRKVVFRSKVYEETVAREFRMQGDRLMLFVRELGMWISLRRIADNESR